MRKMNNEPLDEEERDLADAIEDLDTRELHKPTASEQNQFRSAAREYRKAPGQNEYPNRSAGAGSHS